MDKYTAAVWWLAIMEALQEVAFWAIVLQKLTDTDG